MKKLFLATIALMFSFFAEAKLTDDQVYLLNRFMGPVASQIQLGALLDASETVNGSDITSQASDGHLLKRLARVTFDATSGSNGSSTATAGRHSLGVDLPTNALITKSWLQIVTPFSTGNGGEGKLGLECGAGSANILSSTDLTGQSANAVLSGVSDGAVGNMKTISQQCSVIGIVSGGSNLTAGKANVFLEYVQGE